MLQNKRISLVANVETDVAINGYRYIRLDVAPAGATVHIRPNDERGLADLIPFNLGCRMRTQTDVYDGVRVVADISGDYEFTFSDFDEIINDGNEPFPSAAVIASGNLLPVFVNTGGYSTLRVEMPSPYVLGDSLIVEGVTPSGGTVQLQGMEEDGSFVSPARTTVVAAPPNRRYLYVDVTGFRTVRILYTGGYANFSLQYRLGNERGFIRAMLGTSVSGTVAVSGVTGNVAAVNGSTQFATRSKRATDELMFQAWLNASLPVGTTYSPSCGSADSWVKGARFRAVGISGTGSVVITLQHSVDGSTWYDTRAVLASLSGTAVLDGVVYPGINENSGTPLRVNDVTNNFFRLKAVVSSNPITVSARILPLL